MLKDHLRSLILTFGQKEISSEVPSSFSLEVPPEKRFGDFATNAAMTWVKSSREKKNPHVIAEKLVEFLRTQDFCEKVEIAGPGFVNVFIKPKFFAEDLKEILTAGEKFGQNNLGNNKKVLLEFISANPTGPLTIANGRGGFGGDVLAHILKWSGFNVATEYYVNDAGNQIEILGKSIQSVSGKIPDQEEFYKGEYIAELAQKYSDQIGADAIETGSQFAKILLENEIKPAVEKMGVKFNNWFSEKPLRETGGIEKTLQFLKDK